MLRKPVWNHALTVALLAAGLGACGGNRAREEVQYVDEPVSMLYSRGAEMMDRGRWPEALQHLQEAERLDPRSVLTVHSM